MEMEYTKKDIKKAPKVKKVEEGVHKIGEGYGFFDKKNDVTYTFEDKEKAEIAYKRHYG